MPKYKVINKMIPKSCCSGPGRPRTFILFDCSSFLIFHLLGSSEPNELNELNEEVLDIIELRHHVN